MSITTLEYSDNFGTSNVRCSFEIVPAGQSNIRQDWTIVCWHNEAGDWTQLKERKDYNLEMYGACDDLDSFPQSTTILHSWLFYALVLHLMLLH